MVFSKLIPRVPFSVLLRRAYHEQRAIQNKRPQGLTVESLRRHYALQPLFFIMGCVVIGASSFVIRSFYLNVDITSKESPYWDFRNKQTKFSHYVTRDFEKAYVAPDYKNMTEDDGENFDMPIKNH
eukprot:TRINITY_DN285_c0_g1_i1.p1 TRINITY_DN285_c0_g1~~TRINITY_DN285_c0_g1_i1.p1  ORF type:complete len:126 (+),score=34.78 TRINITY_DN285_c0_g1_i1:66-443(+)